MKWHVRKRPAVEVLESRRLLSAVNILTSGTTGVQNTNVINEYTQSGTLLATIAVPQPPAGYGQLKDVIVDPKGNTDLFYGAGPSLGVYNGSGWSFYPALNWSLFGVTYEGKIAAYNNYIYAESQSTGVNKGIIRFDSNNGYAAQLYTTPDDREIDDISMGLDGNLYSTAYKSNPANDIVVWDPNSMAVLKTIPMNPTYGGNDVAADAQGNLYILGNNYLYKMTQSGTVLDHIILSGDDIKISTDGLLLVSSGGKTEIVDENLNVLGFFNNEGSVDGPTFSAWNTYQTPTGGPLAAPTIFTQPSNRSATASTSVSFFAGASGNPVPTVQWQISTNGTTFSNIPGATSTPYTFSPAVAQNGDLLRAVFTNSQSSATSTPATLTVIPAPAPPAITTQPGNQSIAAGQNVSFTAAASGYPVPSIQWQISTDGTTFNDIFGATSATYTFTAAAGQNGNLLRSVFTNSLGSATTNAVVLTVTPALAAPNVTTQPANQSVPPGQNVSFTAAASGYPVPTVQWQISTDGTTFNNIAGATATTYTFSPVLAQNGNQVRAVFTNSKGSATTNAATLTVSLALTAPTITTQPANQSAQEGQSVSFTAAAGGNPSPTVQWQMSINEATFADIAGATAITYTFIPVLGQNGAQFRAVFTNSQGVATSNGATLAVTPAPSAPTITTQPGNQSAPAGQTATFTATADGTPSPTVQWQISTDGTTFNDIPGATSPIYTVTATAGQTGNLFRAVFTNSSGSATSDPAVLNPGIAVGTTPSPAILTLGHVTLPTVAVVGLPFNGKVPVTVTNTGATTLSGNFTLNIYANANPVLDGGQTFITSLKSHFALKSTKSRTLIVKVRSLPAGLTPGPYYAVTEVVDPQGGSKTTATGQPFQLDAAVVTLKIAQGGVLPATIPVGKFGSVSVTVTNTGNVVASGPLVLTLSPSSDGVTPVAGVTLVQINARRVRIAPGKSAKFKLRFKVTAATTTGPYFPYLSVSLAGVTQTAVGGTQFTID